MSGGTGTGPGIAVPINAGGNDSRVAPPVAEAPKAAAPKKDDCTEDPIKPKAMGSPDQSRIIAAAQAAGGVEGKIRLEILVDETGNITSVRVMAGLGGAIDDAAVAAYRRVKISPATRCGKPVSGRLVVAFTVRNPD
jgi:protein TonB